jgi:hypothetical protein
MSALDCLCFGQNLFTVRAGAAGAPAAADIGREVFQENSSTNLKNKKETWIQ